MRKGRGCVSKEEEERRIGKEGEEETARIKIRKEGNGERANEGGRAREGGAKDC